jgi:hypothetical protein
MLRLKGTIVIGVMILFTLFFGACTSEAPGSAPAPMTTANPAPSSETEHESPVILRDWNLQDWDVTHARDVYGMNPDYFNFGLGMDAIPSIDDPRVIEEGDPDYPEPDSRIQVFGVDHNGERRAYRVSTLSRHEVINDVFPGESNQYVAVTY